MLNLLMTAALGFLAWIAISVVDLKTETAVISVKVDENHKMLTTLWQDYIRRAEDGNLAWVTRKPNLKAPTKTEVEQSSEVQNKL